MARLFLPRNAAKVKLLYVVEAAVGRGCANHRDDVYLIQLFLRVIMEDAPESPGYRPPGEDPIKIDGIYGRQTQAYIDFFQAESNKRNPGQVAKPDGRIDPPKVNLVSAKVHGIFALNRLYQRRRGAVHDNIQLDPLFPSALQDSFYCNE